MSLAFQIAAYITTYITFPLAMLSCALRIHCCASIKHRWKPDDFMSVVVGVFLLAALGLWQYALLLGCAGPEPNACHPSSSLLTWLFTTSLLYDTLLHFLIRLAFYTSYLSFSRSLRFLIGLGLGADTTLLVFHTLVTVFRCEPLRANFNPEERARCMSTGVGVYAPAVMNALMNLYVLLLPIPVFYRVQVPLRRKRCVCCVFGLGGAAVALGFIRVHSLVVVNSGTHTSRGVGEGMVVGALGMSLAAVAHNLPSLRVLWKHVSQRREKVHPAGPRKVPSTSLLGIDGTVYNVAGFSRPVRPCASQTDGVHRPLPAGPRYPIVDGDFGSRPRTPPRVAWPV